MIGRDQEAETPFVATVRDEAASAVFTPIAILAALYYRIAKLEPSISFAASALLLSVIYALATEQLNRRAPRRGLAAWGAQFATVAVGEMVS